MPRHTRVVVRWEPDDAAGAPAYRAYDAASPCADWVAASGGSDLARALLRFEVFGHCEVVDVEGFRDESDRDYWTECLAQRTIGRWLADPRRPSGNVYTSATDLLGALAKAGIKVQLARD